MSDAPYGYGKIVAPRQMLCGGCGAEFDHPPNVIYSTLPPPQPCVGGFGGAQIPICPKCGNFDRLGTINKDGSISVAWEGPGVAYNWMTGEPHDFKKG